MVTTRSRRNRQQSTYAKPIVVDVDDESDRRLDDSTHEDVRSDKAKKGSRKSIVGPLEIDMTMDDVAVAAVAENDDGSSKRSKRSTAARSRKAARKPKKRSDSTKESEIDEAASLPSKEKKRKQRSKPESKDNNDDEYQDDDAANTSKDMTTETPKRKTTKVAKTTAPASATKRKTKASTKSPAPDRVAEALPESGALIELPDDIVIGELRHRPSKRNRSPYVGDVYLPHEDREAIVHLPNLDMGGKCRSGAQLVVKPARDRKGDLVGPNAVNPKYNTPKCEYIAQLLRVDETSFGYTPAVWVGAHPSLGEKIAEQLIGHNLLGDDFPAVHSFRREVRNPLGMDMRADFVVRHKDPALRRRIVEVKTVVDTDYAPDSLPTNNVKCVFTNSQQPYRRNGIFPWGNSNQKGPDGESVVSARAIKHVRELAKVAKGEHVNQDEERYDATILFVVIREDAVVFRPNHDACPSFAKYLKMAKDSGVQVLAKQVRWGEGKDKLGKCFEGDLIDIVWPDDGDKIDGCEGGKARLCEQKDGPTKSKAKSTRGKRA